MAGPLARPPAGQSPAIRRLSGILLFLGVALLGVPFLLLASLMGQSYNGMTVNATFQAMYTMWGLGIIVIGLSLAVSRIWPAN